LTVILSRGRHRKRDDADAKSALATLDVADGHVIAERTFAAATAAAESRRSRGLCRARVEFFRARHVPETHVVVAASR